MAYYHVKELDLEKRRLWYQQPSLQRVFNLTCGFLLEMVTRWQQICILLFCTLILQQLFYFIFLFDHKLSIQPNLDKFAKVVHNVMYGSPLHSKGIGLEDDKCLVFMKRKLDGNWQITNEGTSTFSIPMKNCLPTLSHWSFDPLCFALFTLHAIVGDMNQNNFDKGMLLIITTPLTKSHHDPTTPFKVVTQFGIPVMENYVLSYQWNFQRTTNTTKKTCYVVIYANGVA